MSRWYPPSKPRAVDNGIKARTARGNIGESWWSRRFLDVLESFALGNRLSRGRTYARKGQVIHLDVSPGEVRADVQGSRRQPYRVRVGLAPFPALVWAKAEIALSEEAYASAKLLAGEVPPELEDIFAAAGAPLFPGRVGDLDQRCSCPDREVPCKHLAAVFYLLAEAFDDDPFLILQWRGRDRDALLGRLRELRSDTIGAPVAGATGGTEAESAAEAAMIGARVALAGLTWPGGTGERFWQPPPPLPDRPPLLDTEVDLLLRQLPAPSTGLGGEALVSQLAKAYQAFGTDAE